MALSKVPIEIWTKIFSNLDQKDLKNVSTVCKLWAEICRIPGLRISIFFKNSNLDSKLYAEAIQMIQLSHNLKKLHIEDNGYYFDEEFYAFAKDVIFSSTYFLE